MNIEVVEVMRIFAKSAFDRECINDKLKRGAAGVEIQLLGEDDKFFSDDWHDDIDLTPIIAIHLPLMKNFGNSSYDIESKDGMEMLKKVCERANKIADELGKEIRVVCHFSSRVNKLQQLGMYDSLVKELQVLSDNYASLMICIENTPEEYACWDNENIKLISDVDRFNVKACFDICHALMTERFTEYLSRGGVREVLTLEKQFECNADYCVHIHIANATWANNRYGYDKGHGAPFLSRYDKNLSRVMPLYKQYLMDVDLIVEVQEDDYKESKNFSETKDSIEKAMGFYSANSNIQKLKEAAEES